MLHKGGAIERQPGMNAIAIAEIVRAKGNAYNFWTVLTKIPIIKVAIEKKGLLVMISK